MQIDCYGFEASSQWFRRKSLDVYLMKEHEGVFYLCFSNQAMWQYIQNTKENTELSPSGLSKLRYHSTQVCVW